MVVVSSDPMLPVHVHMRIGRRMYSTESDLPRRSTGATGAGGDGGDGGHHREKADMDEDDDEGGAEETDRSPAPEAPPPPSPLHLVTLATISSVVQQAHMPQYKPRRRHAHFSLTKSLTAKEENKDKKLQKGNGGGGGAGDAGGELQCSMQCFDASVSVLSMAWSRALPSPLPMFLTPPPPFSTPPPPPPPSPPQAPPPLSVVVRAGDVLVHDPIIHATTSATHEPEPNLAATSAAPEPASGPLRVPAPAPAPLLLPTPVQTNVPKVLVGPVVGRVDATTAVVLLEFDRPAHVTLTLTKTTPTALVADVGSSSAAKKPKAQVHSSGNCDGGGSDELEHEEHDHQVYASAPSRRPMQVRLVGLQPSTLYRIDLLAVSTEASTEIQTEGSASELVLAAAGSIRTISSTPLGLSWAVTMGGRGSGGSGGLGGGDARAPSPSAWLATNSRASSVRPPWHLALHVGGQLDARETFGKAAVMVRAVASQEAAAGGPEPPLGQKSAAMVAAETKVRVMR